jgi:ribonuclease MRP protein subunit RMP1
MAQMKKTATEEEQPQTLAALCQILNALYIRNKNQHRRSSWWKHFSIFRKQVNSLSSEVSLPDLSSVPIGLSSAGERRVESWITKYIFVWNAAFSQLLMERRFASLGLVLMGALARVCAITGISSEVAKQRRIMIENDKQTVLDQQPEINTAPQMAEMKVNAIDLGEVVQRPSEAKEAAVLEEQYRSPEAQMKNESSLKDPKKKRKKHKHEIDDIFASFGV